MLLACLALNSNAHKSCWPNFIFIFLQKYKTTSLRRGIQFLTHLRASACNLRSYFSTLAAVLNFKKLLLQYLAKIACVRLREIFLISKTSLCNLKLNFSLKLFNYIRHFAWIKDFFFNFNAFLSATKFCCQFSMPEI